MRVLFIGDIVGEPGRHAVAQVLPKLKQNLAIDITIANGENSAGGIGITKETALDIFESGVEVITLGNHVWSKRDVYPYLDEETRIVRPANYPAGAPGRGWTVCRTRDGRKIGILNLCGRVFMETLENPFTVADKVIETLSAETSVILVDFHGEATSEKTAFSWYVDGRVSAVLGTHTHVQTADERILPKGTAFLTDTGMTGPMDSVIGMKKELVISRFLTNMPSKFEVAGGPSIFSAVLVDIDPITGKATGIERILKRNIGSG